MNLKSIIISVLLISMGTFRLQGQTITSSPETKFIAEFYSAYMTICDNFPTKQKELNALKSKCCTSELLEKLDKEDLDYDPFLNAQDCEKEWINSIRVIKTSEVIESYLVTYETGFMDQKTSIKVWLINENEGFKINSILPIED